jgi:hypothetical protein
MAKRPLNHFDPVLLLSAAPSSYSASWDMKGVFAKDPDATYIADGDWQKYDVNTGFGPDARLDLHNLELRAYVEMREGDAAIWGFGCEYMNCYSVRLESAERMVATLKHINAVRMGYEEKGFYAKDVEEAMLQVLDAVGCTRFATPTEGFGVINRSMRSGWDYHSLGALSFWLKKIADAYSGARAAAVA